MVQKKEMTADFEQLTYNKELLRASWDRQLEIFKNLSKTRVAANGFYNLISWMEMWYSEWFFVHSAMWRLFISKPTPEGKLNYQQTLLIEFDPITSLYTLEYSDWDTINLGDDTEKAILWKSTCFENEVNAKFIEFMRWHKDW
jgi:hypothetical protein